MTQTERNLSELRSEIAPLKPIIVAVTKYFGIEKLIEAYDAGLRDFAENRVQDAIFKFENLSDEIRRNSRFHLIGHLQSNKVKKAVGKFDLIQSVDSLKLAELISQEAMNRGITQHVLLQVNNANEDCKFGFSKSELNGCFDRIVNLQGIKVDGLMNIAPIAPENELRVLFEDMRNYKTELEKNFSYELKELSMGMSSDYRIALAQGSTMIRLGRKIFM